MRKWINRVLVFSVVLIVAFFVVVAFSLVPSEDSQPLPEFLISAKTAEGQQILQDADALADYDEMAENFESQKLTSFCGVASSSIVLNALGKDVSQTSLFNDEASEVRPIWQVAVRGMTIQVLAEILESHGVEVATSHADASDLEEFRQTVIRNLSSEDDYMLVNYQREELGQSRVGHISPIAAYNAETDRVLVMDTAAYKYPHTWVPLEGLFGAMTTIDGESGISRGWIEVRNHVPYAEPDVSE